MARDGKKRDRSSQGAEKRMRFHETASANHAAASPHAFPPAFADSKRTMQPTAFATPQTCDEYGALCVEEEPMSM